MSVPPLNAHTASKDIAPLSIAYETEHCHVRELDAEDACETICGWMADPDIAKALNAPARALSIDDVRRYITSHDRVAGHLLGVFRKTDGALIGLWSVYVEWRHSEFLINVLIPGRIDGELGAMKETGRPLYGIMFRELGLGTMRYNILASNQRMHDRAQVVTSATNGVSRAPEHASSVNGAGGQGKETVYHYRMSREDWLKYVEARGARDALWREARKARRQVGG